MGCFRLPTKPPFKGGFVVSASHQKHKIFPSSITKEILLVLLYFYHENRIPQDEFRQSKSKHEETRLRCTENTTFMVFPFRLERQRQERNIHFACLTANNPILLYNTGLS